MIKSMREIVSLAPEFRVGALVRLVSSHENHAVLAYRYIEDEYMFRGQIFPTEESKIVLFLNSFNLYPRSKLMSQFAASGAIVLCDDTKLVCYLEDLETL